MSSSEGDASNVEGRGRMVVVCGYPGVGKTTVSETIADRIDGELLRTDVVRKELYDDPQYSDEETRTVYETVFERGGDVLASGGNVVLDGTFFERTFRDLAERTAREAGADCLFVRVECDQETVVERIRQRENGVSDADVEVYHMHRDMFDEMERDHVTVDNSRELEETRRQVRAQF